MLGKIKSCFIGFDRVQCYNCEEWFRLQKLWKFEKPLLLFNKEKRLNITYHICSNCAFTEEAAKITLEKIIENKRPKYEESIKKEAILARKRGKSIVSSRSNRSSKNT